MGGVYGGLSYAFDQSDDADSTITALLARLQKRPGERRPSATRTSKHRTTSTCNWPPPTTWVSSPSPLATTRALAPTPKAMTPSCTLGVEVPVGNVKLSASYANSKTEIGGATSGKASGFGLGATYAMSKRTRLYAGYRDIEVKNGAGVKTSDSSLFAWAFATTSDRASA